MIVLSYISIEMNSSPYQLKIGTTVRIYFFLFSNFYIKNVVILKSDNNHPHNKNLISNTILIFTMITY